MQSPKFDRFRADDSVALKNSMHNPTFKTLQKSGQIFLLAILVIACQNKAKNNTEEPSVLENAPVAESFQADYDFLQQHDPKLALLQNGNGLVLVSPSLQGRIMTSSANGMQGSSYGWINKAHYESGEINPQINVYGGEERFWLGPEGGQYSIFFDKGEDFTFENWSTPKLIDLEPFEITEQTKEGISFSKAASLTNYADYTFDFHIDRSVSIISNAQLQTILGISSLQGINAVGYTTENTLKNTGSDTWTKENGLLSIWLLGMYKHSETTTVVIPFQSGEESTFGKPVNIYESFGEISTERLQTKDSIAFFKGDGEYRCKIGLSPQRAKDIFGSYDAENGVLTLVKYNKSLTTNDYVNSKWELQDRPFGGDVINSYNDGPVGEGNPLGPFYELETSSPAAALAPNESITHIQHTVHLEGDQGQLDTIAQATLGVSLKSITEVFEKK
ncbi:DUF6786 family protein [Flagellimonas myxillae]|uniref:DUF6786 family protein n=1 Tax=Flagellimonas myxillae TaxID=2942214 RepID=UPI00201EEA86|nr:DUF6786 family protein [Muricauda myxillae]MCL6267744.1 hypothetical protein [Muricauda myxillae]